MSSAVAEIQKDLQEHRSRGGDGMGGGDFDEAEVRALSAFFFFSEEQVSHITTAVRAQAVRYAATIIL